MAMLYRVAMNVIHVPSPIVLVADEMLPESPLPNRTHVVQRIARHVFLDFPPTIGEIRIAIGKAPKGVKMIGQNHDCIDHKVLALYCISESIT